MTTQEIFDKIVKHLRVQGKKSVDLKNDPSFNGITCVYRSPEGLSCAVGCLIPDDEYDPDMEDCNILTLVGSDSLSAYTKDFLQKHYYILRDFQNIHDGASVENWEIEFKLLARNYNLNYSV